jgi:hypothetical protein
MADQLFFSRDTKVFIKRNNFFYEIPVLDGYAYSQAHNISEVTLNEAADSAGTSRRARQVFNDSFAPTEWSFSTYIRPFAASTGGSKGTLGRTNSEVTDVTMHAVEEALWDAFVDSTNNGGGTISDVTDMDVDFTKSNKTIIGTFDLYFVLDWKASGTTQKVYKIAEACINEASIDFDIDGIAQINWSGMGGQLTDEVSAAPYNAAYDSASDLVYEGVLGTNNYIRNKLTTLALTGLNSNPSLDSYNVVLTGGNITLSNNITYLTPETIGSVNQPLGHVTGTRTVGGNFTAYLDDEALSTAELFTDIAETLTTITTEFNAVFSIGGSASPKVEIALAKCHLEIPTFSIEDVISVDVNFHGLPSAIEGTDEATIKYFGVAVV